MDRDTSVSYVAPELRVLGTVEALTLADMTGAQTDATFPAHTPLNQLTFSN